MKCHLRKLSLALPAVLAAVSLAACGDSHTKVTTGTYAGESGQNAPYLDVGPLVYEVQLSRQLNPTNPEDVSYLQGLSPEQAKLEAGQEWFGVFVQVYNNGSSSQQASTQMSISDTQGNTYTPIVAPATNLYAYRGGAVRGGEQLLPPADTTAYFGPTQGSLLLFKIKLASLDNRPLELKIVDPADAAQYASAELDV
jgi:hypothetical protein